ncbi:Zinc finger A20 and AN1 domain-containing stress-associated protein 5 [Platanthera zijinensis]|uniref:Zinc finger A20 and AN1 domain-containing stress-associated protein 5 n=1 Tax=Platanthera zijinensis TaxID=2320716 RepID=A0AAP0BIV8_9ASPA
MADLYQFKNPRHLSPLSRNSPIAHLGSKLKPQSRFEIMAQEKEMDIPSAETLNCFQAANAKPTSPTHSLTSGTGRSAEILIAGLVERTEVAYGSPSTENVYAAEASGAQLLAVANRCSGCHRKVGLMGFRCRCGELFCWKHRYSDGHDCNFDYKTAGRIAISRDNPLVRASKIVRI